MRRTCAAFGFLAKKKSIDFNLGEISAFRKKMCGMISRCIAKVTQRYVNTFFHFSLFIETLAFILESNYYAISGGEHSAAARLAEREVELGNPFE